MRQVGTFEAKTHFSALIDAVERGETVLITRNGRPVARMVRAEPLAAGSSRAAAVERILARDLRVGASARALIDEGRKY